MSWVMRTWTGEIRVRFTWLTLWEIITEYHVLGVNNLEEGASFSELSSYVISESISKQKVISYILVCE